jgi:hypothetical protein
MSGKRAAAGDTLIKQAEISPDLLAKLDQLQAEQDRTVLHDEFESTYRMGAYYEKRRSKLKEIPNFWFTVLQNDTMLVAACGNHSEDHEALKYIEDLWVTRSKPDPRAFTIEMVGFFDRFLIAARSYLNSLYYSILRRTLSSQIKC